MSENGGKYSKLDVTVELAPHYNVQAQSVFVAISNIIGFDQANSDKHEKPAQNIVYIHQIFLIKQSSSKYALLNSDDSRVVDFLHKMNSSSTVQCIVLEIENENTINEVRFLVGRLIPHSAPKSTLKKLICDIGADESYQRLIKTALSIKSRCNEAFPVEGFRRFLGGNAPSHATITKHLVKNEKWDTYASENSFPCYSWMTNAFKEKPNYLTRFKEQLDTLPANSTEFTSFASKAVTEAKKNV